MSSKGFKRYRKSTVFVQRNRSEPYQVKLQEQYKIRVFNQKVRHTLHSEVIEYIA